MTVDSSRKNCEEQEALLSMVVSPHTPHGEINGNRHQEQEEGDGSDQKQKGKRILACFLITIPIFLAYGTLIKLQSNLRTHLWISNSNYGGGGKSGNHTQAQPIDGIVGNSSSLPYLPSDGDAAYLFGFAVSFYYIGLLTFRLGHNIVFGFFSEGEEDSNNNERPNSFHCEVSDVNHHRCGAIVCEGTIKTSISANSSDVAIVGESSSVSDDDNDDFNRRLWRVRRNPLMRFGNKYFSLIALHSHQRVIFSIILMAFVVAMIPMIYYVLLPKIGVITSAAVVGEHYASIIAPILVLYFFGGCAIATFEPNIMACITPLGPQNKALATTGIPFGTNGVTLFVLFTLGVFNSHGNATTTMDGRDFAQTIESIGYGVASLLCLLSVVMFVKYIPSSSSSSSSSAEVAPAQQALLNDVGSVMAKTSVNKYEKANSHDNTAAAFIATMWSAPRWIALIKWPLLTSVVDQLIIALSVAITQYIYGSSKGVPMLYPFIPLSDTDDDPVNHNNYRISHNVFLVIFFVVALFSAAAARQFAFMTAKAWNPVVYLGCIVLPGIALVLSKVPIFALAGIGFIMFGNGGVYSSSLRIIDESIGGGDGQRRRHTLLVAISLWMAIGDIGGFVGANLVVPIHAVLGSIG